MRGGVTRLAAVISSAERRRENAGKVMSGYISGEFFVSGKRSYPFTVACDCNTANGAYVFAQITESGEAVVVG